MRIRKRTYIGSASLLVAVSAFLALVGFSGTTANALTMGSRRDCGYTDPIVDCGATSTEELLQKYDSNNDGRGNQDIQAIYKQYGLQRSDITGSTSQIKKGWLSTDGTITVDGEVVAKNAQSVYRSTVPGKTLSPVSIGGKTYYIGSVGGNYTKGADVFVFFRNGKFHTAIQSSCGNPIPATPTTPPKPQPEFACENLTSKKIDRNRYRFTATASAAGGAAIAHYVFDFGNGKTKTQNSNVVEYAYDKPGTYTVKVKVNISIDGKRQYVTSEDCAVTVEIEKAPVTTVYRCDSLNAQLISSKERTYVYTLKYTTEGDAALDRVVYDFGDGTSETFSAKEALSVRHQYAQAGTFTTTATLYFDVENESGALEKSDNCEVTITIAKPDNCPLPGKEDLPKNSPSCKEVPCPIPGKEDLPKDSPDCAETPPELPTTGLDMFIGGGLGVGSITAAGYYWSVSRKNLLQAFLKK